MFIVAFLQVKKGGKIVNTGINSYRAVNKLFFLVGLI
jgi:hypothetical protein